MTESLEMWNDSGIVSFFDDHRLTEEDVYPSEWFFLEKKLRENMSVLDIGCAQGGFSNIIKQKIKSFSYTGVDVSKKMIEKAMLRHPEHTFYHIEENNYSGLNGTFDVTLVLGILHLHEAWRETVAVAWEHTKSSLILDLRETFGETMEDKNRSYFDISNGVCPDVLPYNVINAGEALSTISSICAGSTKISYYGYSQKPSDYAVCPIDDVFAVVYCVER